MSIVFKHQVEASEQATGELEGELGRKRDSLHYEVQALLKNLVQIVQGLNGDVAHWHEVISSEPTTLQEEQGREIFELYRRLEHTCQRAAQLAAAVERSGPPV